MRQSVAAGLLVLRNRILSADNLHEDGGDYGCAGVFVCVFVPLHMQVCDSEGSRLFMSELNLFLDSVKSL